MKKEGDKIGGATMPRRAAEQDESILISQAKSPAVGQRERTRYRLCPRSTKVDQGKKMSTDRERTRVFPTPICLEVGK